MLNSVYPYSYDSILRMPAVALRYHEEIRNAQHRRRKCIFERYRTNRLELLQWLVAGGSLLRVEVEQN